MRNFVKNLNYNSFHTIYQGEENFLREEKKAEFLRQTFIDKFSITVQACVGSFVGVCTLKKTDF